MQTHAELTTPVPFTSSTIRGTRLQVLTGRALSGFAVLFLTFDGVIKLIPNQMVVEASQQLGYRPESMLGIGITLLACLALYVIPRTAPLGALLLTAYLGGAVATHVRIGNPLFSHVLFPTYVAAFLWAGLVLRRPALRVLLPFGWRA